VNIQKAIIAFVSLGKDYFLALKIKHTKMFLIVNFTSLVYIASECVEVLKNQQSVMELMKRIYCYD